MPDPMRILLINQVFYPDVAATAQHGHDLARHLVAHGHAVDVIASRSIYGRSGASLARHECVDGIRIHRVGRSLFGKRSILLRAIDFALFYLAATIKAFMLPRADVVVCFTTPPFIALLGWLLRAVRGSRFIYWVMDLYPDVAVASGVMKPRSIATRFFDALNRFCLRRADRTVVLGRCMLQRVREKGVTGDHVVHIGVWSDSSEVTPLPRDANPYRAEWALGAAPVVMYAGNLGLAHDVTTLLDAAVKLDGSGIELLIVGGGKRMAEVERFIAARDVRCRCEPYQPRERLDALLSCGDIHLVTLASGFEGLVVPCKLFGIMAAERPTIFIGEPSSEIARVLVEHECGIVVEPGDSDALVAVIRRLAGDPAERARLGTNARAALHAVYDRHNACEAWRVLIEEVGGMSSVAPPVPRDAAPSQERVQSS